MELRVLSGLHRGAALAVADGLLTMGASPRSDVMVADPGIAPEHVQITKQDGRCTLLPVGGQVFDAYGSALHEAAEVVAGAVYRMGEVWIGFFEESDPWLDAIPAPALPQGDIQQQPTIARQEPAPMAAKTLRAKMTQALKARFTRWLQRLRQDSRRRKVAVIAAAVLCAIVLPLAWMGTGPATGSATNAAVRARAKALVAAARAEQEPLPASGASTAASGPEPAAKRPALTPDQLAEQFQRFLADRSLLDKVELELANDRWDIRASLDEEDKSRLERALRNFQAKFAPPVAIHVSVVPLSDLLPFRVVQVSSGKAANVVLDDGQRLFIGDSAEGYKLMSVEQGKLVFSGRRTIEVAW